MKSLYVAVAAALLGASLSACGGGASSGATPVTTGPTSMGRGTATINVTVPAPTTGTSAARRPQYISSSTTQLVVDVQANSVEVQGFPQTFGLTPTSSGCSVVGGSTQCTLTISLAAGTYAVVMTAEDSTSRHLSTTSVPLTVTANTSNLLNATLSGVLASIVVTPTSTLVTGTQAAGFTLVGQGTHAFTVNALDDDGNVIIGPGAPTFDVSSSGTLALAVATPAPISPNVFSVSPPSALSASAGSLSIAAHYAGGLTDPCPVVVNICITSVNFTMQGVLAILSAGNQTTGSQVTLYPEGSITPLVAITANLNDPTSAAFDSNGNLFVANTGANEVMKYAPPYSAAPTTISSGIYLPDAVIVDPAGDLYVANQNNAAPTVLEYAPGTTTPSRTISPLDPAASMCLDPSGDLFTSSGGGNGQVEEYAPTATTSEYSLNNVLFPQVVACDHLGNVFLARYGYDDLTNSYIYEVDKYGPDLAPITTLNNVNGQTSLAVDSAGKLYVGNEGTTLYVMVIPSGSLVTSLTIPSAGLPSEIVVDGVGNVFVDDGTHNDVVEYLAGATTSSLTIPAATIYFNGGMAVSP